ncbi:hypothetical protein CsSME_00021482 [Camellia sinensis var. sinensis]
MPQEGQGHGKQSEGYESDPSEAEPWVTPDPSESYKPMNDSEWEYDGEEREEMERKISNLMKTPTDMAPGLIWEISPPAQNFSLQEIAKYDSDWAEERRKIFWSPASAPVWEAFDPSWEDLPPERKP